MKKINLIILSFFLLTSLIINAQARKLWGYDFYYGFKLGYIHSEFNPEKYDKPDKIHNGNLGISCLSMQKYSAVSFDFMYRRAKFGVFEGEFEKNNERIYKLVEDTYQVFDFSISGFLFPYVSIDERFKILAGAGIGYGYKTVKHNFIDKPDYNPDDYYQIDERMNYRHDTLSTKFMLGAYYKFDSFILWSYLKYEALTFWDTGFKIYNAGIDFAIYL